MADDRNTTWIVVAVRDRPGGVDGMLDTGHEACGLITDALKAAGLRDCGAVIERVDTWGHTPEPAAVPRVAHVQAAGVLDVLLGLDLDRIAAKN